ncbi:MAG: hypothetical protein KDA52_06640 [Planctomycetaceae bacterium]|nr:hypothetical protein [Planctomycetaceae bacterium]
MPLLLLVTAAACSLSVAAADDSKTGKFKGIPGTCPQYPIYQVGSEYIYYSYYHASNCNSYVTAYLQGNYPWFVDCNTQPNLCESTGMSSTLREFMGLAQPVSNRHDPRLSMTHYARRNVQGNPITRIVHLDLNNDTTGDGRYAVLHQVTVTDGRRTAVLYYGFETHPPASGTPPVVSTQYIDRRGVDAASPTYVAREISASPNTAHVIFLKE